MKTFRVVVLYGGSLSYRVTASDENDAIRMAESIFAGESDAVLSRNITTTEVNDCWEEIND